MTNQEIIDNSPSGGTHRDDDFIFTRCLDCNFSVAGEMEHCISCGGLNVVIDALDKKEFTIDF